MRDDMVRNVRLTLYLLLGAVALVLLIACANVANLLLAKATARTREIAIRAAVGASRGRIVRQLITESLVLALVAGAAGLIWRCGARMRWWRWRPATFRAWRRAASMGGCWRSRWASRWSASLLFGLAPALQVSRVDLNEALKQGAARAVAGGRAGRMRAALVVAEIALSVVLLAGAGLLIRSFVALHNVALGFRPEHMLVMESERAGRGSRRRAARHPIL